MEVTDRGCIQPTQSVEKIYTAPSVYSIECKEGKQIKWSIGRGRVYTAHLSAELSLLAIELRELIPPYPFVNPQYWV